MLRAKLDQEIWQASTLVAGTVHHPEAVLLLKSHLELSILLEVVFDLLKVPWWDESEGHSRVHDGRLRLDVDALDS